MQACRGNEGEKKMQSARPPAFHMLDLSLIPDDEYTPQTTAAAWLARVVTSPMPFPPGSLAELRPLAFHPVQLERVLGYSLYFALNVIPMLVVVGFPLAFLLHLPLLRSALVGALMYCGALLLSYRLLLRSQGWNKGDRAAYGGDSRNARNNQYRIGERNTQIYHNMRFVWPHSLHPKGGDFESENPTDSLPTIFCVVPHGMLPAGAIAYPIFSKLFSSRLCRWTAAPVIFSIPVVGQMARGIGCIPAKALHISQALAHGSSSSDVGIILDGIAGMFEQTSATEEVAHISARKGIIAIALKVGNVQIVPVYAFGHSELWTPLQDPFGVMSRLSIALNVSVIFFTGRWLWPFGPAQRLPVTLAFGEPIVLSEALASPSPQVVEEYHRKLVAGFVETFDTHKASFGWAHKHLKIV